jgi:hypothetical protein
MAQRLIYTPASLDEGAGFAIALLASGIYGSGLKDAFFREIWNAKDQK